MPMTYEQVMVQRQDSVLVVVSSAKRAHAYGRYHMIAWTIVAEGSRRSRGLGSPPATAKATHRPGVSFYLSSYHHDPMSTLVSTSA